jgi:hypothetical protein
MAAPVHIGLPTQAGGAGVTHPGSTFTDWQTIHNDLTATAETGAVLLRPLTYAGTNVAPGKMPPGATRFLLRGRYPQASTLTTSPVVRLYGVWGTPTAAGVFADDGTVLAMRLDNVDANAAGVTVTIGTTADLRDTTYRYTDVIDLTGFDAKGAWYILALTETAGVISAGSIQLQALAMN